MKSRTILALLLVGSLAGILLLFSVLGGSGASTLAYAAPPVTKDKMAFEGRHGVSVHNWFTWTKQSSSNTFVHPASVNRPGEVNAESAKGLSRAGFQFVRLTVEPGLYMTSSEADQQLEFEALAKAIDRLNAAGLNVIVDFMSASQFQPVPGGPRGGDALIGGSAEPTTARFIATIGSFAKLLEDRYGQTGRSRVAFELTNEPDLPCASAQWRMQQIAMHRAARLGTPHLTLIVTGACRGGVDGLIALNPSDYADENLMFTVHYYDDASFTHQGLPGNRAAFGGIFPYPTANKPAATILNEIEANIHLLGLNPEQAEANRQKARWSVSRNFNRGSIRSDFLKISDWARDHHISPNRIWLGEFGVTRGVVTMPGPTAADRLRWLRDVREEADAAGFRWSVWQLRSGSSNDDFGIEMPGRNHVLDQDVLKVLFEKSSAP